MGEPVIDALKNRHDIPAYSVFTTNQTRNDKDGIMDKGKMIGWMLQQYEDGVLVFAQSESQYMKELKRQWQIFGEYKSKKYEAPSGEHDDLMMALMLACYFIKSRGNAHPIGAGATYDEYDSIFQTPEEQMIRNMKQRFSNRMNPEDVTVKVFGPNENPW